MRPWIKRTLIAVLGVSLLGGGLAAWAHRHHAGMHANWSAEDAAKWRGKLLERAGSRLELDEAQKQQLGVLFDKVNAQRAALVGQTPDPRAALAGLIAGEKFDRERAGALLAEKTGALTLNSPAVLAAAADFYDGLKPAQQAKVREMLARRGGHRGHPG